MKLIRRGFILLLSVISIGLLLYQAIGVRKPSKETNINNVKIIDTPAQAESVVHPDFIKEEYVPVLPEGNNIAMGKKVEANSFIGSYQPRKVTDGDVDDASYWEGKSDYPNILTVDLEENSKIHAIRLCLNPLAIWGRRTQKIAFHISLNGNDFEELVEAKEYMFDPDTGNEVQIQLEEVEARYVQLVITENTGAGGGQIAEFEVYSR